MKNNEKVINKINRDTKRRAKSIDVGRKRDIVLINSCIETKTEDEIRELLALVMKEKAEMKTLYYALNTPIVKTRRRSFGDLLKKYIRSVKVSLETKREKADIKFKRG